MDRVMDIVKESPSTESLNGMPYKGAHYIPQVKHATTYYIKRAKQVKHVSHKVKTSTIVYNRKQKVIVPKVHTAEKEPYPGLVPPHDYSIDLWTTFIIPSIIAGALVFIFFSLLWKSIKNNPIHGVYAHQHKRHHPGVPKPRIFDDRKESLQ